MADSVQMIVYKNGFIRLIEIKNLAEGKGVNRYNLCDNGGKRSRYDLNDKD